MFHILDKKTNPNETTLFSLSSLPFSLSSPLPHAPGQSERGGGGGGKRQERSVPDKMGKCFDFQKMNIFQFLTKKPKPLKKKQFKKK